MGLTRRELLVGFFTKDTVRTAVDTFHEFTKARGEAKKIASCDDAARMLGKKNQKCSKKFYENLRKEG